MWQATKDLILMKQYKKDIQKYYEDFNSYPAIRLVGQNPNKK